MSGSTKKHQKISRRLVSLFFVGCLLFVQVFALSSTVLADAVSGPGGIDELAKKKAAFTGVATCYNGVDVGGTSFDDVEAGKWFDRAIDYRFYSGYPSYGKENCSDGSFISSSLKTIGYSSNQEAFCSMSVAKRGGKSGYDNCKNGSGEFDMSGSKSDQVKAFQKATAEKITNSSSFLSGDNTKAINYYTALKDLQKYCGAKRVGDYKDSMASDLKDSQKKLVVNEVDLSNGNIIQSVYELNGKKQSDSIDGFWDRDILATIGLRDDTTCGDLSKSTWKYDDAFSKFVKAYNTANPSEVPASGTTAGGGNENNDDGEEAACGIEGGLGWVLCPIIRTMANIGDGLFGYMADSFLSMPATLFDQASEEGKAMFSAWSRFRDMANIAFVIFFLFIIYSQLVGGSRGGGAGAEITGGMLSNYGVKKLLPRVIVSAVLINVSFWLCAIAIDLSNIIGYGSKSLFDTISNTPEIQSAVSADNQGLGWTSIALVVIAGAVVWINLAALMGLLGLSIVALIVVVVTLLIRKALIILLIAIAPIAIVAYMLPNTKSWFDKWRKTFMTLLMVFPIIGVVFGASSLASIIVQATAGSDDNMTKILGASIAVLPLIAVPTIIKGSLATIGQLGAKINGVGDKLGSKASSKATDRFDKSALGQFKAYRRGEKEKRQALTRAGKYTGRNPIRRGASKLQGGIYSRMPGKFGDRIIASGTALADKEWDEEVGRQKTSLTGTSSGDLLKIMKDKSISAEKRAAAAGIIMSRGHRESQLRALEIAHEGRGNGDRDMGSIQKQMAEDMKDSPFALGSHAKEALETGNYGAIDPTTSTPTDADPRAELKKRVGTKLSPAGLAKLDPDELKSIHKMARDEELSPSELANLQAQIAALRLDPQYKGTEKPEATKLYDEIIADAYASGAGGVGSAHYNDSNVF